MTWLARSLLLALVLWAGAAPAFALSKAEAKAFNEAAQAFRMGFWERADRELGAFLERHPNADNRAEALLFQAEARLQLKNFAGAIELLEGGRATAGPLAGDYLFWLAEAQAQAGKPEEAAALYSQFTAQFTNSPLRLNAIVGEASARSRLKQWTRVVSLLQSPDGSFQTLAQEAPAAAPAVSGRFQLAEALVALARFRDAEAALRPLAEQKLPPPFAWQRDLLLARIQFADGQAGLALATASNLVAQVTNQPVLAAEALQLLGRIYEKLGQPAEAVAAWKQLLTPTAPPERQREALAHVGDLLIAQGRLEDASQTLETYLAGSTNPPAAEGAWLTLGELRLRRHLAATTLAVTNGPAGTGTNLLSGALNAFEALLQRFPASPLAGKAQLGRGWCLFFENRPAESAAAFQAAVDALPASYDQALARFKYADALMQLGNFNGALTNYQAVAANPGALDAVRSNLVERALCQIVRVATEAGDSAAAAAAMTQLLEDFPEGKMVEDALLVVGNSRFPAANPAARRAVLEGFLAKSPRSKLASGVRLAVARTFEQERDWPKAAAAYSAWLEAFPDDPGRPRAEYSLALADARSGDETNALNLFTNFVARFPTNDLAPLAQWWVADHYWRAEDYVNAERLYQLLNQPQSPLRFEAQMMAGRAAVARQRPEEALPYFTNLFSDPACPSNYAAQAMFAYADTLMTLAPAATNQALANFKIAIQVFSKLAQLNPDTRIALLAQGKMGDCYLQLGSSDPAQYSYASNAYQQVLSAPLADVAAKSQAEVGLGLVLESEAQSLAGTNAAPILRLALDHYLNVVCGNNRTPDELPDPFWVKRAGLEALRLAEALQAWDQAVRLCDTLGALLPPLQPMLEKKKSRALEAQAKPPE
jgi:tetratricopeptide (TPR) repeat protein